MEIKRIHKGATNPQGFDHVVREIFAPIYPVISAQIIEKTKIVEGECLDIGCGTGALGRSIAKLTDLHITFFDQSAEMLSYSMDYVRDENILHRSNFLLGDVHQIPIESDSMNLVVSRGSTPFWDDWSLAYCEICRVLKPLGHAYIGGGFGNAQLRDEIKTKMDPRDSKWRNSFKNRLEDKKQSLEQILKNLPVVHTEIINDESGFWVHIIK